MLINVHSLLWASLNLLLSLLLLIGVPLIVLTVLYISLDLSLGRQVSQLLEMR